MVAAWWRKKADARGVAQFLRGGGQPLAEHFHSSKDVGRDSRRRTIHPDDPEAGLPARGSGGRDRASRQNGEGRGCSTPGRLRRAPKDSYVIAASALVAAVLVAAHWVWPRDRFIPSPQITLLTVPNNMIGATISPDGTRIAYISHDAEGQSLWVRETGGVGAGTRLVPRLRAISGALVIHLKAIMSTTSSRRRTFGGRRALPDIRRGRGIAEVGDGHLRTPAFSPDGGRMVFKRYDPNGHGYLLTATPLGADIKTIAQSDATYPFYSYQWAADGKKIYYVERTNDSNASAWSIWEIPIGGGAARLLMRRSQSPSQCELAESNGNSCPNTG